METQLKTILELSLALIKMLILFLIRCSFLFKRVETKDMV